MPQTAPPRQEASLKKRYVVKIISNLASVPLFFVLEALLPRALGPAAYGNFNFALSVYRQVSSFVDMGTSTCFYNSLSRRQEEFALVAYYSRMALLMLLVCLGTGAALFIPGVGALLLPDVPPLMGALSAGLAYIMWVTQIARSMDDALGLTIKSELVRIVLNIAAMVVLVALFFLGWLNLAVFYLHQYVLYALLAVGYLWCLRRSWPGFSFVLPKARQREYNREFAAYSMPLFVQALASLIFLTAERWILQYFDGSVAQGYFSLSQKVGMACFLFVTAMTPLIMRELAIAHGKADKAGMARLLDRHGPMLYAIAAYFSCFVVIEAEAVVRLFGGTAFAGAILPVQIMALYPMHQSYGQVVSSVYFATGDTKILRNNTVLSLVVGILCSWFLLAPGHLGGLNLGAFGLAVKMVAVQFVFVNFLLWRCSRFIPLKLGRNLAHQLLCPLALLSLALLAGQFSARLQLGGVLSFLVSGLCYTAAAGLLCWFFPWLSGMTRQEMQRIVQAGAALIKRIVGRR